MLVGMMLIAMMSVITACNKNNMVNSAMSTTSEVHTTTSITRWIDWQTVAIVALSAAVIYQHFSPKIQLHEVNDKLERINKRLVDVEKTTNNLSKEAQVSKVRISQVKDNVEAVKSSLDTLTYTTNKNYMIAQERSANLEKKING